MSDVIASEIGHPERIAALSGPNHAEEICRGALSASTIACESVEIGEFFKNLTLSQTFRVYLSSDMVGVELCGAMKNVMAIICGIAAGSGMGDNALALIMTRGLAEISRLVHACGGEAMTCMGLAGMGDLIVTCTSQHSRNRTFGEAFAKGETLEEYQAAAAWWSRERPLPKASASSPDPVASTFRSPSPSNACCMEAHRSRRSLRRSSTAFPTRSFTVSTSNGCSSWFSA